MPTRLLIAAFLALSFVASRQADAAPGSSLLTIRVKDRQSGQPVQGAVVLLDGNVVAETGASGAAKIADIAPGRHLVSVMSLSHDLNNEDLRLEADEIRNIDFALIPSTAEEVTVVEKATMDRVPVSEVALSRDEVTRVAGTMGDPVRVVESLPGMGRTAGGLGGALIVRGPNPADTSVFVDGVEVPLLYHFGGLTSVISSQLLGNITFPRGIRSRIWKSNSGRRHQAPSV